MTISAQAALASLQKSSGHLPSSAHERIVDGLRADGLISDSDNEGAIQAAAGKLKGLHQWTVLEAAAEYPQASQRLRRVQAQAARLGFPIKDNEKIDTFALDAALHGKDLDERMRLKAELASLHLIP